MKEEKKFNTPYEQFIDYYVDDQCSFCRFNNKKKKWHCDRESIWSGENPCLKTQEHICPIARANPEDFEI